MNRTDRLLAPLVLTLVLTVPAFRILPNADAVVVDPDVFLHLAAGRWIVEHGTVPTTDPFSLHGQGQPWVTYEWLFQLLIYRGWLALGPAAIVVYTLALMVLIGAALTGLLLRIQPRLPYVVVLVLAGLLALSPAATPRPWLFSILFYILELDILLTAGRTGKLRYLCLLPLMFALWANTHIQFILGGVVLALAIIESVVHRLVQPPSDPDDPKVLAARPLLPAVLDVTEAVPLGPMVATAAACGLASLLNPYHVQVYAVAVALLRDQKMWNHISEFMAMPFRRGSDWIVLGSTLAAVFCIGWRKRVRLFLLLLLLLGIWSSFRSARDLWVVLVVDLAIVAGALGPSGTEAPFRLGAVRWILMMAVLTTLLGVLSAAKLSNEQLEQSQRRSCPVAACTYVLEHHCRGPLFNHFDWGGYLIWRLHGAEPPLLVGMDGRSNIHGEDRILENAATWLGRAGWEDLPDLKAANLVIAQRDIPLASLLKYAPGFKLVHEDEVAAVFVRDSHSRKDGTK